MTDTPGWWTELTRISDLLTVDDDEDDPFFLRLAAVARAFADSSSGLTESHRQRVLSVIEDVLRTGSESDQNAAATGFLESLVGAWDRGYDLESVWKYMGPESRDYCLAWNKFSGIASPDWMSQQ